MCVCACVLMCSWIGLDEAKGFYESIGWDLVLGPTIWIFFFFLLLYTFFKYFFLNLCYEVCTS